MNYVVGLVFNKERKKIVLIQKHNPEWQAGLLNGVGGKMEEGEFYLDAMTREFEEEAGVKTIPSSWEHIALGEYPKKNSRVFFMKMFDDRVYNQARTMEIEPISKFWISQLPDYPMVNDLRWLIPLAINENRAHVKFTL